MSEILNIKQLKEMAYSVIDIPGFDSAKPVKVKVQRPRLFSMAKQGKIPNHLMSIATSMLTGKSKEKKKDGPDIEDVNDMMELYCYACLVEPSYDEFKEIITDDQKAAIFDWGIGRVSSLDSFRTDKEDGTDNNNVKEVQSKTK